MERMKIPSPLQRGCSLHAPNVSGGPPGGDSPNPAAVHVDTLVQETIASGRALKWKRAAANPCVRTIARVRRNSWAPGEILDANREIYRVLRIKSATQDDKQRQE